MKPMEVNPKHSIMTKLIPEFHPEYFEQSDSDFIDELFMRIVADRSMHIDARELRMALRKLGYRPTHREAKRLIDDADEDGSGTLSYEEFLRLQDQSSGQ